ncbi:MAG: hypothetical protein H0X40_00135 [Chthoniobacterales bacterium]|nr:hypothetical protein [Chthoniobacterales bacterium]
MKEISGLQSGDLGRESENLPTWNGVTWSTVPNPSAAKSFLSTPFIGRETLVPNSSFPYNLSATGLIGEPFRSLSKIRSLSEIDQDPEVRDLKREIVDLQNKVSSLARHLSMEQVDKEQTKTQLALLKKALQDLNKKEELRFLLSHVSAEAKSVILGSDGLRAQFFSAKAHTAYVVSIDIRRSTELMLKARTPSHFAAFMTHLCSQLENIVKESFGVFDKFTGDGILAFFPEFFSGPDAGFHALAAAERALATFADSYRRHRSSFTTVLRDVHLAIGIDFGSVHLVKVADSLTVVGGPVVYACRLSSGPPGTILLNQPAYERISDRYGGLCLMTEPPSTSSMREA